MKRRSNQEQREKMFLLLKSCKESGKSNKDFCQENGIGQAMFYYWQKKFMETQNEKPESFIPVQFKKENGHSDPMEIIYPNGVRIKVSSTTELSIVRTLIGLA